MCLQSTREVDGRCIIYTKLRATDTNSRSLKKLVMEEQEALLTRALACAFRFVLFLELVDWVVVVILQTPFELPPAPPPFQFPFPFGKALLFILAVLLVLGNEVVVFALRVTCIQPNNPTSRTRQTCTLRAIFLISGAPLR